MTKPPERLCCGRRHWGVTCPDGLTMCCVCFERFGPDDLYVDGDGMWDMCRECHEAPLVPPPAELVEALGRIDHAIAALNLKFRARMRRWRVVFFTVAVLCVTAAIRCASFSRGFGIFWVILAGVYGALALSCHRQMRHFT